MSGSLLCVSHPLLCTLAHYSVLGDLCCLRLKRRSGIEVCNILSLKNIFSSPAIVNVLKSSRCDFYICTNLWHYSSSVYLACQLIVSVFLPSCCAHSFEGFKMLLQKYSSLSSQCFPQRKPSKLFPSQAYFLTEIIAVHWTLSCWGQSWILRSFDSLRRSMWVSLYKLDMQWAYSKDKASPLAHSLPHCSFLWEYLICI